jgi:hypothetical protein
VVKQPLTDASARVSGYRVQGWLTKLLAGLIDEGKRLVLDAVAGISVPQTGYPRPGVI